MIVLAAAPLAKYIPLPTLAAILMVVAYRMGEWHAIPSILRLSAADRLVWAATFLLTVFADLTVAVEVGMVLAALLYIHRVSETTTVTSITDDDLREAAAPTCSPTSTFRPMSRSSASAGRSCSARPKSSNTRPPT